MLINPKHIKMCCIGHRIKCAIETVYNAIVENGSVVVDCKIHNLY